MSRSELENRRHLAVQSVKAGYTQRAVAKFWGVHEDTVGQWVRSRDRGGEQALNARVRAARPSCLSDQQWQQVAQWVEQNPMNFGYPNELWTSRRVADQIEKHFGVRFNYRYVSGRLAQMRITPQKPQHQPREKDQQEIDRWLKEDWRRILKKPSKSRLTWF
jgi:transposase